MKINGFQGINCLAMLFSRILTISYPGPVTGSSASMCVKVECNAHWWKTSERTYNIAYAEGILHLDSVDDKCDMWAHFQSNVHF